MTITTDTAAALRPIDADVQKSTGQLRKRHAGRYALAVTRIMLAWIFLWGFLDKLLGLGKYTPSDKAWIKGGSPTEVFASQITYDGPFTDNLHAMAGTALADVLFMGCIGVIAISLSLGIGLRIAAVVGTIFLATMEILQLWPSGNPFLTPHWIDISLLIVFVTYGAGDTLGLGRFTHRVPWLR